MYLFLNRYKVFGVDSSTRPPRMTCRRQSKYSLHVFIICAVIINVPFYDLFTEHVVDFSPSAKVTGFPPKRNLFLANIKIDRYLAKGKERERERERKIKGKRPPKLPPRPLSSAKLSVTCPSLITNANKPKTFFSFQVKLAF